jgi:O-methyltransferase
MKLFTFIRLLRQKFFSRQESDYASFVLAQRFAALWYPKMIFGEYGKIWEEDAPFFSYYRRFEPHNYASAERKFFLRSLLSLTDGLPGETAECGVYQGASSWLICEKLKDTDKTHYIFDSFEGLSEPSKVDGQYWSKGALRAGEEIVKANLSHYPNVEILRGWIPERFAEVSHQSFCFVHIDVDLYQPTLDSLSFFYPRLVRGGLMVCDDYGFSTCPGAKRAFDEYMKDKPEKIIHVPTGQGFIIKGGGF